jgi:predicted nucleic acid-binding protein
VTRRPVVIDASIGIAITLREPRADAVLRLLRTWSQQRRERIVPSQFWYELVNGLGRRHLFDGRQILEAIYQTERLGLRTVNPDRGTLMLTIDRVERLGLSSYDALYLALAESLRADLATFDRTLAAAAGTRAITFDDGHRVHEPAATYERDVTWPRYREASTYLAKLRAETLAARSVAQAD